MSKQDTQQQPPAVKAPKYSTNPTILLRLAMIGSALETVAPGGDHHKKLLDTYGDKGWPGVDVYSLELLSSKGLLQGVDIKAELERVNNIYTTKEKKYLEGLGD